MQYNPDRNKWLLLSNEEIMKDCSFEGFQASGPGGQKRNRKYSAVRLVHIPTNISATAVESRSQINNRNAAIKKLKIKLAMEVRGPEYIIENYMISLSNPLYPLLVAVLFDKLYQYNFAISDVARSVELSTAKVIKLIARDKNVRQKINELREIHGLKKLLYRNE